MGIVVIVMATGTVGTGNATAIVTGKGTVIVIATEIAMAIETVKEVIGTEREGRTEMQQIGRIKKALRFLILQNVRKVDGTIERQVYSKAVNCSQIRIYSRVKHPSIRLRGEATFLS